MNDYKPEIDKQRPGWAYSDDELARLDQLTLDAAHNWGSQRSKAVQTFRHATAPYDIHRLIWEIQQRRASEWCEVTPK